MLSAVKAAGQLAVSTAICYGTMRAEEKLVNWLMGWKERRWPTEQLVTPPHEEPPEEETTLGQDEDEEQEQEEEQQEDQEEEEQLATGLDPEAPAFVPRGPTQLYVGNMKRSLDETNIAQLFSRHGRVLEVEVIRDFFGLPRGYAFVQMASFQEAMEAIQQLNGLEVRGRELRVRLAH